MAKSPRENAAANEIRNLREQIAALTSEPKKAGQVAGKAKGDSQLPETKNV
jgi:hypothetical protein